MIIKQQGICIDITTIKIGDNIMKCEGKKFVLPPRHRTHVLI